MTASVLAGDRTASRAAAPRWVPSGWSTSAARLEKTETTSPQWDAALSALEEGSRLVREAVATLLDGSRPGG